MTKKRKNKQQKSRKTQQKQQPAAHKLHSIPSIMGGDFEHHTIDEFEQTIKELSTTKGDQEIRVLVEGEASFMHTGFSTYWREVIERIKDHPNVRICELGSYAATSDDRAKALTHEFHGAYPETDQERAEFGNPNGSEEDKQRFHLNQFGKAKFDKVCAKFKPHIVLSHRDYWMGEWIKSSPFRSNFLWFWMPTVDGYPQKWEWIRDYAEVDKLLTYSFFGKKVLEEQSRLPHAKKRGLKELNVDVVAQAGVNPDKFKPVDRKVARDYFGLPTNINIIGTVMRNQPRKLFPRIIEAFAEFKKYKESTNAYLLLHTSIPDVGWDIPEAIDRCGVQEFILSSYKCNQCAHVRVATFQGSPLQCPQCHKPQCFQTPNTNCGFNDHDLNMVYNLMDLYVQGSIAEGCFAPGTSIQTREGTRPIEQVSVGDEIFTHEGKWQTVNKFFINGEPDDMVQMNIFGCSEPIIGTSDHKVFVAELDNSRTPRPTGEITSKELGSIQGKIDWVACPIDRNVQGTESIKISDYVDGYYTDDSGYLCYKTERFYKKGLNTGVKDVLSIDSDFCYILGLLAGDGSYSKNTLSISGCSSKMPHIDKFAEYFRKATGLDGTMRQKSDTDAYEFSIGSKVLCEFFRNTMGTYSGDRRLPDYCKRLPLNKQRLIIKGFFDTDGHNEFNNVQFTSSSLSLLCDFRMLLARQNICMYISGSKQRNSEYKLYTKVNRKELGEICQVVTKENPTKTYGIIIGDYSFHKVRKVVDSAPSETFNIQMIDHECVENTDSTYVISPCGIRVSNCGMPCQESKAAGIIGTYTDYSALYEKNRNGGAFPLKVETMYTEPLHNGTMQWRALFSRDDLVDKMRKVLSLSPERTQFLKNEARQCAVKYYDWDMTAAKWLSLILKAELKPEDKTWGKSIVLKNPTTEPCPEGIDDVEWLEWAYKEILCRDGVDPDGTRTWLGELAKGVQRTQIEDHFRSLVAADNKEKQQLLDLLQEKPVDAIKTGEELYKQMLDDQDD